MRPIVLLLRREMNKQVTVTKQKKHLFWGRNNTRKGGSKEEDYEGIDVMRLEMNLVFS